MGKVVIEITMSLDGYVAGPNISVEHPMGEGGQRLHDWMFGGKTETDAKVADEIPRTYGAVIVGGRTYHDAINDAWGGVNPFEMPAFVLTSRVPKDAPEGFTFVTDGIESALSKAQAIAGDKKVWVMGGANTIQQYIQARRFDELYLHIAPVLMGTGTRLFDDSGHVELDPLRVVGSPAATHLHYRVKESEAEA